MPASITAVRDGLKVRLETIAGLRGYSRVPDKPEPPCAVVLGPVVIEFDHTMARGCDRIVIPIQVLASKAVDDISQTTLDGYLGGTGATSIKQAVEGDRRLGGIAQSTRVMRVEGYGQVEYVGIDYLGARLIVEVVV